MTHRKTPVASEWLIYLERTPGAFGNLLEESGGSLARAAHRVAVARAMAWQQSTDVPTKTELYAAAHYVALKAGIKRVPAADALARECEMAGLLVLT